MNIRARILDWIMALLFIVTAITGMMLWLMVPVAYGQNAREVISRTGIVRIHAVAGFGILALPVLSIFFNHHALSVIRRLLQVK